MKLPKELITVTPLSKLVALILFIMLPILFFFIGMRYQSEIHLKTTYTPTTLVQTPSPVPTVPEKMQQPYGKVSIQGVVISSDQMPAVVDGSPTIMFQISNNTLFEIMLPSGESSCTLPSTTNEVIQSIKVGDTIEVYGTAATSDRIIVCDLDDYIKISSQQSVSSVIPFKVRTQDGIAGLFEKKNYVINSQTEWESIATTPGISPINFDQNTVIVVAQGQKPTGGYLISVEKIEQANGKINVSIIETIPGNDCMVTLALTAPSQIVEVKKLNSPVTFSTSVVTTECR